MKILLRQYQMDTTQQQMNYMRGVNGQTSFHPGVPFIGGSGDLTNLSTDLQQSSYEFDKQVSWTEVLNGDSWHQQGFETTVGDATNERRTSIENFWSQTI